MMVTDRTRYGAADPAVQLERLEEAAARAARARAGLIQIRERGLDDRTLLTLVRRIRRASADTGALVVVNGRTDVALAAPADGVHLPSASPDAGRVRRLVPPGFLIGKSVHSVDEARAAEEDGCDYLVFGTVFPTTSKPPGHTTAGVEGLQRVCAAVRLPVLAIGGVTPDRLPELVAAGAAGIAGIGLFASSSEAGGVAAASTLAALVSRVRNAYAREPAVPRGPGAGLS
jgi:thiamine-phosphate pyrophosphorylase